MGKIYVVWSDYDGSYIEEFDDKKAAETRVASLLADVVAGAPDPIEAIIEGVRLEVNITSRVSAVTLNRPRR